MDPKWTPKVHFFCVYKSSEFIVKNRVWAAKIPFFPGPKLVFSFFFQKTCFFTTQRFASTGSSFFRFKDLFFHHFRGVFGGICSGRDFGMKREHAQF